VKSHSRATPPALRQTPITLCCVLPLNEYALVDDQSSPSRTTEKLVESQLATSRAGRHERLVGAGVDRLDPAWNRVEPAVRVEAQVEDIGGSSCETWT
jgi:hypothetical protein